MNLRRIYDRALNAFIASRLERHCKRLKPKLFKMCPDLADGCTRMMGKIEARKNSTKVYRENVQRMNKLLGS